MVAEYFEDFKGEAVVFLSCYSFKIGSIGGVV